MLSVTNLPNGTDSRQLRYLIEFNGNVETGVEVLLGVFGKTPPDLLTDSVEGWLRHALAKPVKSDADAVAALITHPCMEVTLLPTRGSGTICVDAVAKDGRPALQITAVGAKGKAVAALLTVRFRQPS